MPHQNQWPNRIWRVIGWALGGGFHAGWHTGLHVAVDDGMGGEDLRVVVG